jgi:hypothetical protein
MKWNGATSWSNVYSIDGFGRPSNPFFIMTNCIGLVISRMVRNIKPESIPGTYYRLQEVWFIPLRRQRLVEALLSQFITGLTLVVFSTVLVLMVIRTCMTRSTII